jgi:tetratricopeptide (TPR) repeat protein/Zn-dependent protease
MRFERASLRMPALKVRAFGVPIEVRASFFFLIVLIGLPTHLSPASMLAWVVIATIAVLAHEAGHAAAFVWFGDRPSITLHGAGAHTVGGHPGARRMIVVAAAGPVAGLVVGLWVLLVAPSVAANPVLRQWTADALFATIGLSLVNLIPLAGLDGNTVLTSSIAAATGRPPGATAWIVRVVVIVALIGGALWLGRIEIALFLAILAGLHWRSVDGLIGRPGGAGSAARLFTAGRPAEALVRADADLQRHPNSVDALLIRAAALTQLTRYAEAESAYTSVLQQQPASLPALAGRSHARRMLGLTDAAGADLDSLLAAQPHDVNEISAQFIGLYYDHQYKRGLALLRSHCARPDTIRPVVDHLRTLEAVVECVLGQTETALGHAQALVARRPDDPSVHEVIALTATQLGRLDMALDHAKRALAGAPRHPELLETLGIVERLSGQPEQAYAHLLEAATARPDLPRARAELSACFTQLGRPAEAALALENLPPWAADDPFVNYAHGCMLAASGHYDEARACLARAARIRPNLAILARVDPIFAPLYERGASVPQTTVMPAAALS